MKFSHHPHSFKPYALLASSQIMVGINIVGSKYLLSTLPVLFILTGRFLLATVFFGFFYVLKQNKSSDLQTDWKKLNQRDWLLILGQAICAGVLFNFLMVLGLNYTNAQSAGIITSTLPALIAIIYWLILKERFTLKKIICVSFATFGLIAISMTKVKTGHVASSFLGNLLVFISLLPEATYYVLAKLPQNHLPIFLMATIINAINTAILLPIALWQIHWHVISFSGMTLLILIIISLASGLFYVCWFLGANKVDSTVAALATAIMPLSTVLIAWLALGEIITRYDLLGMGLVIMSIIAYAL